MDRLLDALAIMSLALILSVLFSIRRAHIRVEYSVSWLVAALLLLVLSRWGGVLRAIGDLFDTAAPASLLMVCGCVFLVVLYRQSLRISSLKDANIALTQQLAILEYRLESLDEKVKARSI